MDRLGWLQQRLWHWAVSESKNIFMCRFRVHSTLSELSAGLCGVDELDLAGPVLFTANTRSKAITQCSILRKLATSWSEYCFTAQADTHYARKSRIIRSKGEGGK
jgi:hypothetical protein